MAKTGKRSWLLVLFALPFAAVGVGMLFWSVVPDVSDYLRMMSWESVQGELVTAELDTTDQTTPSAMARYRYEIGGRLYESDRVGISGGGDNIGDWQVRTGQRLRKALDYERPIVVFVNPDDPQDAVIDRDLRWGLVGFKMVFVLVFGGAGFGLLILGLKARTETIPHSDHADKPWLTRREWASPTIYSGAKSIIYFAWGFALVWNLVSSPLWFIIPEEVADGNYPALIGALFPLVGLGLLAFAIHASLAWRRFGRTPLTLDPYPGSIGGHVGGHIDTNIPFNSKHRFAIDLSCLLSYVSGSGKNRSRHERVEWQSEGFAYQEPAAGGTRLSFCFDVPARLPQSEPTTGDRYHHWRLNLNCALPGVDLDRTYELPVFPTAERARQMRGDATAHVHLKEQSEARIKSVVDIRPISGGAELYHPMLRTAGGGIAGTIFGAAFFGIGVGIGHVGAPLFFSIVFGGVGGFILLGSLYGMLNSLHVRIDHSGIRYRRRLLGFPVRTRRVAAADVRELRVHKFGMAQRSGSHGELFSIRAHLEDGRKVVIAESLVGADAAARALERIASLSGYRHQAEALDGTERLRNWLDKQVGIRD